MASLKWDDVRFTSRGWFISSARFKTKGPHGVPTRLLSFSRLPFLHHVFARFLTLRVDFAGSGLFVTGKRTGHEFMMDVFEVLEKELHVVLPCLQPHSLKRGTVSMLKRLGMSVEDINLHVGWSLHSNSFSTY